MQVRRDGAAPRAALEAEDERLAPRQPVQLGRRPPQYAAALLVGQPVEQRRQPVAVLVRLVGGVNQQPGPVHHLEQLVERNRIAGQVRRRGREAEVLAHVL